MEYFGARLNWPLLHEIIASYDDSADSDDDQNWVYQDDMHLRQDHKNDNNAEPNDKQWDI